MPEVEIEAIAGELLLHVPPLRPIESVIVLPVQTLEGPEIKPGAAFIVMVLTEEQPALDT